MTDFNPIFIRACEALWGERWQSDASRALEMSDRHIRRIVAGAANANGGMLVDLWRMMLERQAEMDDIIEDIKRHGARQDFPDRPDMD